MLSRVVPVVLLSGCSLYFADGKTDAGAGGTPDAAPLSQCLTQSQRSVDCHYDLSGTVVDLAAQAPVADPVELHLTTAWDDPPYLFPGDQCLPLEVSSVASGGAFALTAVPCDSPIHPPIAFVEVVPGPGGSIARVAWDYKLTCGSTSVPADCGAVAMATLAVPSAAQVAAWRAQMLADGMADADTRGLVLMLYRELDGTPAAGVQPTQQENTMELPLPPGSSVRFLAADRVTLIRADATTTGISGLAIIAIGDGSARIGGARNAEHWAPTGVLASPGWIFAEDRTKSP